jgi:hypothetical protein
MKSAEVFVCLTLDSSRIDIPYPSILNLKNWTAKEATMPIKAPHVPALTGISITAGSIIGI